MSPEEGIVARIRRARLVHTGWDEDLLFEEVDEETGDPAGERVEIEVEACGVCSRDCIDREGRFPSIRLPITPGHEVVGRVIAVGSEVTDWSPGDRLGTMHRDSCGACPACRRGEPSLCAGTGAVPGLLIDGGYATHMGAPQRCFFRVPENLPAAEAAVMHCTFGTAYRGLRRCGEIRTGDHVLVTGANGGVGVAAVQVAARLGASVTAVVRDRRHESFLRELGAEVVIVDPGDRFHKQLPGDRADVVLDCVGPPTFNASLRSLRTGGHMVVIGNVIEEKVALNLGYLITSGIELIGSSGATREHMKDVFEMHAERPFRVHVHQAVDLAEADRAQRAVKAGGLRGRIVLYPRRGASR
jgi:D-arabinose 1-dehydrogenase-like Zn-dependent alcohol dehydrogenase